jgi:hypothetical protein
MDIKEYLEGLYERLLDPQYAAWYLEDAKQYGREYVEMAIRDIDQARLLYEQRVDSEGTDTEYDA